MTRFSRPWLAAALGAGAIALVSLTPSQAPAGFPGENGRLAFHSDRDGDLDIYSIRADGTSVRQLTDNPAPDRHPSYSASGHLVLFERGSEEGPDLYVMAADGSSETRVARRAADPVWSPDGRRIAFRSSRDGNPEIYVMDADGSSVERLTITPPTTAIRPGPPTATRSPSRASATGQPARST